MMKRSWVLRLVSSVLAPLPVRVMERLIRSMAPGTPAILDLEDGYLDVRDPARTGWDCSDVCEA